MEANELMSETGTTASCCSEPILTIEDKTLFKSIFPFSTICKLTGKSCAKFMKPLRLSDIYPGAYGGSGSSVWHNVREFWDSNESVLIKGSFFNCIIGTTKVTIVNAGQDSVTVGAGGFSDTVGQNGYSDSIVEGFISSGSQDQFVDVPGLPTDISITGGFMEDSGHGYKSSSRNFIDGAGNLDTQNPGNYNIGIDYVFVNNGVEDGTAGQDVEAWFGGTVIRSGLEGGYGNRVHIQTGRQYEYNGVSYPINTAYAHLQNNPYPGFSYDPANPIEVNQGQAFAQIGGTGSAGAVAYPVHVDFQIYIETPNGKITLSPNLFLGELIAIEGATIACPNAMPPDRISGPR